MSSSNGQVVRPASRTPDGKGQEPASKTQHDSVELGNIQNGDQSKEIPLESDIMQCARLGETGLIQKMFESGKFKPSYKDEEAITPLHWAAINNQYATCKFLIEAGADVNAKGGESVATPAMWAAQKCHYYIVHLLLKSGADPLLEDGQGYNILHLATIDGNVFLLVLLLHQEIPVDVTDPQQHTSLMWAAYKGFPACVDLLLRWGANVNATDDKGLTPLHWALVKGSQLCTQKIIEFGGDRFAETRDGKTPSVVAEEMKTTRMWHRALADCGYDSHGHTKALPLGLSTWLKSEKVAARLFYYWPFFTLFLFISIISHFVVYIGVPTALAMVYLMQWTLQRTAQWCPSKFRLLHHTPFLAGWFAASLFLVGFRWVYRILPATFTTNPFTNLVFAVIYGLTTFFYFVSMMEDPGFVPKLNSRNKERETIEALFELWKFDQENFCLQCMIRRPLRSKHCRRCGRCIAKHDHHCPWINNCVAVNNVRHFYLYIFSLEVGILLFIRLVFASVDLLPSPTTSHCTFLPETICNMYNRDPWTWVLAIWAALQLIWVTMLLVVQSIQISRNQTTLENMRQGNADAMLPNNASRAVTATLAAGAPSLADAGLTASGTGPNPTTTTSGSGGAPPRKRGGFLGQWIKLLGLDTFVATARGGLVRDPVTGQLQPRPWDKNPWSRGLVTNCTDFWADDSPYFGANAGADALLGGESVNYARMYDMPRRRTTAPGRGSSAGRGGVVYTSVAGDEV